MGSTVSSEEPLLQNLTDSNMMDMEGNVSMDGNMSMSEVPAFCGQKLDTEDYRFWLDGVLVAVVGSVGFVGNLLALIVLSRRQLQDVFHQLLFALACFDILFLVFGGISYTFRAFYVSTDIYTYLFPYLVSPMTHVAMAGTIFMTLAISIERYLGLCHPLLSPHSRKSWMYVLPVVIVSAALNVPKFFEIRIKMEFDNTTNTTVPSIESTELRTDKHYILGYIMWTRLFSTAVIPVLLLIYLNVRIIIDLMRSTKVKRFGSQRVARKEMNLSIVLLCIVVIFFCCHAARIILDIHEFTNVEKIMACKSRWWPGYEMQVLVFFSHFLMILNSSVNFVVYCLVGHTFRREMCRAFGLGKYSRVPGAGLSRRSSRNEYSMPTSYAPVANNHFNSSAAFGGVGGVGSSNSNYEITKRESSVRFLPSGRGGSNGNFAVVAELANNGNAVPPKVTVAASGSTTDELRRANFAVSDSNSLSSCNSNPVVNPPECPSLPPPDVTLTTTTTTTTADINRCDSHNKLLLDNNLTDVSTKNELSQKHLNSDDSYEEDENEIVTARLLDNEKNIFSSTTTTPSATVLV